METSSSSTQLSHPPPQSGAYILRKLATDLPLSADGQGADVRITCVEVWNSNLYIGTSAGEIIHFVLIPPEPNDPSGEPTAIQASRLQPPYTHSHNAGIQQILLLPKVNKACILCNNTLTFYSLPELSPAFPSTKPLTCSWVGGVDLNVEDDETDGDGVVVMVCLKSRIRMVRISEEGPRSLKTIEYGGCIASVRRDNFSCAADSHSYALLDVENQQKIGLFPISSLDPEAGDVGGAAENIASALSSHLPSRSASSASNQPRGALQEEQRGHVRSTSLGVFGVGVGASSRTESPRPMSRHRHGFDVPESLQRSLSPAPGRSRERQHPERHSSLPRASTPSPDKALPPTPDQPPVQEVEAPETKPFIPLKAHIASPNPSEFLLTVGTTPWEPGVGMFVNLDGDITRGTMQFASYPDAIVVDGSGIDLTASIGPNMNAEEGYVLAAVHRQKEDTIEYGIEIQRWDVDPGEAEASKEWLDLTSTSEQTTNGGEQSIVPIGIRRIATANDLIIPEVHEKLAVKRLKLPRSDSNDPESESQGPASRQEEADLEFTERLSRLQTRIVLWAGDRIWWAVRNPMVTRLDAQLQEAQYTPTGDGVRIQPNRTSLERVINTIRGQEPRNEAEWLSLVYIRQKASVLLFMELILRSNTNIIIFENEKRTTEQALIDGEVDPRIILALIPILEHEVVQGPQGIWVSGGLSTLVEQFLEQNDLPEMPQAINGPFGDNILHLVKRYLLFWKKRKGMASVTNDPYVFQTVDAALLHILLLLDRDSPKGPASAGSLRAELNELVDNEVECFDRAVELLEQFRRLYVLSRLYQRNSKTSVKASKVLGTWKRILEGEPDDGGEFLDGEQELRKYLSRIRDRALVEEYGAWLANRNPKLGVQIFADDQSRVKFDPPQAVALLKEKAPGAVKEYLEYLVFGKKHTQYVNELITFYLDIVIHTLSTSPDSRSLLLETYTTYRALHPPRPTYRQFITDNNPSEEWWTSRLRLLQLLGSSQQQTGASGTSTYDVPSILTRLAPYEAELVPEMIILNGRQGRHEQAIRLLTHGLGDFDTAINYCLLGGSSIFRPPSSGTISASQIPSHDQQSTLFNYLLHEFLHLEDLSQRIERTSELLERFAGWFDVVRVLEMVPDDWGVDVFRGFLVIVLRGLVRERCESDVVRALSSARNLGVSEELVVRAEELGATVERVR